MNKLLVILGSTSTGKTDVALALAKRLNGELVACDSRQVYQGLDIGTGKLPGGKVVVKKGNGFWEIDGIKVWMYDVVSPSKQYTVYDYAKEANNVIAEILKRGSLPIIVGGTGFYLKALLEGLPNLSIPMDKQLRRKLEKLSLQKLQDKLQSLSPDKWDKLNDSDKKNPRRLIRAIEISILSNLEKIVTPSPLPQSRREQSDILKIGLTVPREVLYQRIDERVISRIKEGMIEEAKNLHQKGLSLHRMRQLGLEYGVLADYIEGKITTKEEFIRTLQGKIHRFARRQTTWFRKEKNITWFDITTAAWKERVERMVDFWYYVG